MVTIRQIINNFLTAYTDNCLDSIFELLDDQVVYQSTNLGTLKGAEQVIQKLKFGHDFDLSRVTTTNRLSYTENNTYIAGLIAHHLVSYEKNNELFPLVFGGKYVFHVNMDTRKITKISFVLEYQAENTIYVKGLWKQSNGRNDYTCISDFNTHTILENSMVNKDICSLVNLFFWALDTKEIHILKALADPSFSIMRDQSVGHDTFTSDIENIDEYITSTKEYFSLDQNSIRINSIEEGPTITVNAQRLTPHRLGTKKLNSLTKYHSFFDEDIFIVLDANTLKIISVRMKKAADVYYNGISILEY